MQKKWRAIVFAGLAVEVLASLAMPGCGSSSTKNKVPPVPYNPDAGASGEGSTVAGAPAGGSSGNAGTAPVAGGAGEGGAAGSATDEGGAAGASTGGMSGGGGSGGAPLTGCALGQACCAASQCESSLDCLGTTCSCVADLSNYYMVRTDGIAFFTVVHDTAQTVISNADTGLPLRGIQQIMGSLYHGCAALDSGQVRCWSLVGDNTGNNSGQLGNGTVGGTYATLSATLVKTSATTNLSNVIAIGSDSMTYYAATTTCAATSDGSIYCWGDYSGGIIPGATSPVPFATRINTSAQGTPLTGVTQVAVGQSHACALTNGKVRCWGQTGVAPATAYPSTDVSLPTAAGTVLKVVAGFSVSCALMSGDGGSVYCWGNNAGGKLANGDPATVGYNSDTPVRARLDANTFLNNATDLVASYDGACVIRADHSLLCWGSGMYYATPMAVGGVAKTANNVAITDAAKVSAPNNSTIPRYVTTSGVEYSEGKMITPDCSVQE